MSTYRELSREIREGKKRQLYFLYGEEEYVKDRLTEQLTALLRPSVFPELNEVILRDVDDETVIGTCMTPPMMADSKLVIVRGCTLLSDTGSGKEERRSTDESGGGAEEPEDEDDEDFTRRTASDARQRKNRTDRLTEYLEKLPQNISLVFIERGKVPATGRFFKWLNNHAQTVNFSYLTVEDAVQWMTGYMRNRGMTLDRDAADRLYTFAGPDMGSVANELEKIELYLKGTGDTRIRSEHVMRQVQDRSSVRIFILTDHLGMGRIQNAYESLAAIRRGDVESYQLLYMIARQYRLIARTCMLSQSSLSTREIIQTLGVQDFIYRNLQRQAAATGLARADKALQILLDAEEGLKTGRYRDADLVVESCMAMIAALYAKRNS